MADTTKQLADQSFFIFVKDTNTGKIRRLAIPGDVQVGLQDNPAELQLHGRLSLATVDYRVTGENKGIIYSTNNDTIIAVSLLSAAETPVSGRITVYLPANPRNGQLHFIKDMSGTAGTVPIDIFPPNGVKIDQFDSRTLDDPFGSFALYWFGDRWRRLVAGIGVGGGGGAVTDATYVTLSASPSLTNERRLNVSGTNLTLNDSGPNAAVTLDLSAILAGGQGTFTYATVTADQYGRITAISNGTTPAPTNASYVTINTEGGLSAERQLTAGTGISIVDGGANGPVTISATAGSGTDVSASYITVGNTGSLPNERRLAAGTGIVLVDGGAGGSLTINTPWTDGGATLNTTSSVSIDGQGRFVGSIGQDVYFFVSGTIGVPSGTVNARRVAVFGGDVRISGSLTVGTGSVTVTSNDVQFGQGTRIERAGADLKFYDVTNPQGQTLTSLIGGGGVGGTSGGPTTIFITGSGWTTVYDRDFALEPNFTASAGGVQTIAGLQVNVVNFNNAEFVGIVNGEGLIIDPNANNSDYYLTVHTAPALYVTMSSLIPDFSFSDYEIRLWLQYYNQNDDANFEFIRWGLERADWSSNQNYALTFQKGFAGGVTHACAFWSGSVEYIVRGVTATNNVGCIHAKDDRNFDWYTTSSSLGQMPPTPAGMTYSGQVRGAGQQAGTNNVTLVPIWNTGSNVCIFMVSQPVNTNNSLRTVIRRLRLEALKKTPTVVSASTTAVVITGSNRINYHGLDYGPIGLWQLSGTLSDQTQYVSNLTASAGTTRYTVMGPGLKGFMFDGGTALTLTASLPTVLATAMTGAITWEGMLIIEPIKDPAGTQNIWNASGLTGDVNGSENNLLGLTVNPFGNLLVGWETNAGTNIDFFAQNSLPFNRLFHLAVTRDTSGVVRYYVDGALQETSTALTMPNTGSVAASSARFNFGFFPVGSFSAFTAGTLFGSSSMASVKLIGRALTDGEVAAEYQRTLGGLYNITSLVTQSFVNNTYISSTFAASGFQQSNYAFVTSSNQWAVPAGSTFVGEPVLTASITTTGSPVFINVNANYTAQSGTPTGIFSIARNGVNLGHPVWGMKPSGPLQNSYNDNVSIQFVDFPPAGTYSYTFIGCNPTGSGYLTAYGVGPASILAFEMKGANVVTASSMVETAVPGGNVTGLSASITPTKGPVLAIASLNHAGDNAVNWAHGTIARNGNNLAGATSQVLTVNTVANEANCFNMMFLDQGATIGGSNTYNVQATQGAGTGKLNKNNSLGTLILWELPDVNFKYATSTNTTGLGGTYTDVVPSTPPLLISSRGRPILLGWAGQINTTSANGRSGWSFLRNGSAIASSSKGFQLVDGENNNDWNRVPSMFWLDVQPAGSYQYQVAGFNVSGSQSMNQSPAGLSAFFIYELDPGTQVLAGGWTDTGNELSTTSSIAISDGTENITDPKAKGQDVYFYVSGTIGVSTASNPQNAKIALFGGDVRVSGSLKVGSGSVQITSNDIQFGDGAVRIERSGNDLKVYDVNNPAGKTLSNFGTGGGSSGTGVASSSIAEFVPAQNGQTFIRWKFNNESLVGNNIYLNTGVSGSAALALTASKASNIRTGQSGVFGESVGFSDAYLASNEPLANIVGSNITVSAWIRPVVTGSGFKSVITKQISSGSWVSPFAPVSIYQLTSNNAQLEFGVTTGGTRTTVNSDSNTALVLRGEQWNHIALVYNGANILGYINGTEVARTSKTGLIDWGSTPGGWGVGGNIASNGEFYSGSIDDIRIEANAWTPEQIREHYETGLVRTYVTGSKSLVAFAGGLATATVDGYSARYTAPDANVIHQWRLNEASSATSAIDSVSGSNMSLDNSQVPATPIKIGQNSPFNGSARFPGNTNAFYSADTGVTTPPSASFTLDCWIQFNGSANAYIFGRQWKDPVDASNFAAFSLAGTGNGSLGYWMTTAGGSEAGGYNKYTLNTVAGQDAWHHYGATYDGANVRLYLDGELVFTEARTGNADFQFSAPWFIGNFKPTGTSRPWTGKVMDARVHNTVRPESYFRSVYNLGLGYASGSTAAITAGVTSGSFAARPAPGLAGRVYLPTDSLGTGFMDNGVAWQPFGPLFMMTKPPTSASWTNVSLGTAAFTDENDALFLSASNGGAPDIRIAARAAPATPYKITACIVPLFHPGTNSSVVGVAWRDSGTGKIANFIVYTGTGGGRVGYNKYNSPTSFNSSYFDVAGFMTPYVWLRLEDDGTNRRVGWSSDGKHFFFFGSTPRTDFLTPDQVCILVDPENISAAMTVLSWKVE